MSFSLILKSIVSNISSSVNSSASSRTQLETPVNDFKLAVWFPADVLIPLNSMSLLFLVFTTSALFTLNISSNPNKPIFSKNSGIIDKCADTIVYLVNNTLMFADIVSSVRNTVTANDLPEPLPPVIIK